MASDRLDFVIHKPGGMGRCTFAIHFATVLVRGPIDYGLWIMGLRFRRLALAWLLTDGYGC